MNSSRSTTADTQRQIHSSGYQCQIKQQRIAGRINSSGYTAADTAADIQHSRHSGRYTMADIYTVTDIQPDTRKNDLTRRVTRREAVFGMVIHSIFDAWHYDVLWTSTLTRLL
jgi:hypothetical protein